jgi:hypothetical protein
MLIFNLQAWTSSSGVGRILVNQSTDYCRKDHALFFFPLAEAAFDRYKFYGDWHF